MANHARLSPSSAERWMTCPGSVALCDAIQDVGSEYADEGTAAHFLAAACLSSGLHPSEFLGQSIVVDKAGGTGFDAENGQYEVDVDMAGHVNHYVQAVRAHAKDCQLLAVEVAVPIGVFTGEEGAAGTADAITVTAGGELQVHDLKYGQGVKVSAERNKQLLLYALGANNLYNMAYEYDRVRVFIHQPRVSPTASEWSCSLEDLAVFAEEVARASAEVFAGSDLLEPSEDACRWCRAKTQCPALTAVVQEMTSLDFDDLAKPLAVEIGGPTLGNQMRAVPLVEQWCKAVRAEVERELFAGNPVDGFKVVQGRRGDRAWADKDEAEKLLKDVFRLKVEEMYDLKLISPTSAEKLAKAGTIGPRQWKKVEALVTRADGKPSVAPESDPRPALVLQATVDDFDRVEEEDLL